jgi:hypothetical protein
MHHAPFHGRRSLERLLPAERRRQSDRLRRRIRRRAQVDAVILVLHSIAFSLLAPDLHDRLLYGVAALSVGILVFMIRRSHDVATLARAERWRGEMLDGRGVSLADWHRGARLPAWQARRGEPA